MTETWFLLTEENIPTDWEIYLYYVYPSLFYFLVKHESKTDKLPKPEKWVADDFWEPSKKFEESILSDASEGLDG